MAKKNHDWIIGKDPPLIRPHSLAKHRVLKEYLKRYVATLTINPRQDQFRLTLIDGFAGGGLYLDSHSKEQRPGSPLIMLEAMREAAEAAKAAREKPFHLDVEYIFIEKNKEYAEYLRKTIQNSEYQNLLKDKIKLVQGDFVSEVPNIISIIKKKGKAGRAIFFLDQFGYKEVPLPTIHSILSQLDKSEVILTFATDFLIDYLSESEQTQRLLEKIGMSLPQKDIVTAKADREWRRTIQFALHREIPEKTGAKYYTPFFIRSTDAHRDFWLIHLSGHYRARDVMVGLHWAESTSFAHYGRSGLNMLGYDQDFDSEITNQKILPGYFFDQTALVSTTEELLNQLPERIHKEKDGIPFSQLFSDLTNDCPATANIMKGVLGDLVKQGVIKVRDKTGQTYRRSRIDSDSDIIIPNRQKRIIFRGD
jgi:three-Cys-motif partner protein